MEEVTADTAEREFIKYFEELFSEYSRNPELKGSYLLIFQCNGKRYTTLRFREREHAEDDARQDFVKTVPPNSEFMYMCRRLDELGPLDHTSLRYGETSPPAKTSWNF